MKHKKLMLIIIYIFDILLIVNILSQQKIFPKNNVLNIETLEIGRKLMFEKCEYIENKLKLDYEIQSFPQPYEFENDLFHLNIRIVLYNKNSIDESIIYSGEILVDTDNKKGEFIAPIKLKELTQDEYLGVLISDNITGYDYNITFFDSDDIIRK